jgi:outer membrane protein assembly factor BamD (BamD/ComL family)
MHAARNAVQRSATLTVAMAAITLCLLLPALVLAQATPPAGQAPVAVPRAAASAPASAPATTQSAEQALFQQITELRNLPRVPQGKQISEVPKVKQDISDQLTKSLALTAEFLKKYPKSEYAEEILVQRMDTIRLLAVVNDKPLDDFRSEAKKILAGDASDKVRSTVAFMLVQTDLQDTFKALKDNEQLPEEGKAEAWKKAVVKQAGDYIKKYPKSEFAKEFYGVLIETAVQDRNFDRARELLEQLRTNFPNEPAVPQIEQFIQQAAATQPSATQPAIAPAATTQKAPATRKAPAGE